MKLPEDVRTVGDELREYGYATSLIGKAHFHPTRSAPGEESLECPDKLRDLDFWRNWHGPWYGFDHVELSRNHADEYLVGAHYAVWMEEQGFTQWSDHFRKWPIDPDEPQRRHKWDLPAEMHYTTWTADRTIANIEQAVASEGDRPFCCWASFHDPHSPFLVPEPWDTMYDPAQRDPGSHTPGEFDDMPPMHAMTQDPGADWSRFKETEWANHGYNCHVCDEAELRKEVAVYYGMVSFMDQQIGRILDRLDELGVANNTLVVFTTDHGTFLGHHGLQYKGPFHYEDLLRLPFVVRWPGHVPAGATCDALQGLVDLAPTMLTAAGIEPPGWMQGVNQLNTWCGAGPQARDHVIVENRHQPSAVHLRTYIDQRYKLTVYRDQPYGELFDLEEDPGELRNRWDDVQLRAEVLQKFVNAEVAREPTRMARVSDA